MNKRPQDGKHPILKPKDLVGIPWRVAFALQADGWWLRSDIIWNKKNPMPESVTDRPTKAHEYVFLLTKSKSYYYDQDAIREKAISEGRGAPGGNYINKGWPDGDNERHKTSTLGKIAVPHPAGRNRRTVWTIATKPYKGAHFATYPPALVEPCIKAGTSERGVCPECEAPWERVTEKKFILQEDVSAAKGIRGHDDTKKQPFDGWDGFPRGTNEITTTGWRPTCSCWKEACEKRGMTYDDNYEHFGHLQEWLPELAPVPATVLGPFVGSGTTLMVARQLGRNGIGLDLSEDYLSQQARKRLELDKLASWQCGAKTSPDSLEGLPLFQVL